MDDIQAALLINQISRIDDYRRRRQEIESLYRTSLANIEGLSFIQAPGSDELSAHHLFTVLLPSTCQRDMVLHQLQATEIGCAVNYRAVHTLTYFKNTFGYHPEDFPEAYSIGTRTITLPLYPKLQDYQIEIVCENLKRCLCVI